MTGKNAGQQKRKYFLQKGFAGLLAIVLFLTGSPVFMTRSTVTAQILLDEREPKEVSRCQRLEQQLASAWIQGNNRSSLIPELNKKIAHAKKDYNKFNRQAERRNCYESLFIFGRSLRKTRRCIALDRKIRRARSRYEELKREKDTLRTSTSRESRREDILAQLARYNCGDRYQRHARRSSARRFNPFGWGDDGETYEPDDGSYSRRNRSNNTGPEGIQPYATYRTMCVRLCDGFYFPINFAVLPNRFERDAGMCQDKCAAPARLFVYRNPGADIEQMADLRGAPYSSIKNAYRYRKKFIQGCSCKVQEYTLGGQNKKAASDQKQWNTETERGRR